MAARKKAVTPRSRDAPLPADVRATFAAAHTLLALLAVVLVAGALLWLWRWPGFALRDVQLQGSLLRTNVPTLRAQLAPRLNGNFFSVDLQQLQQAFQAVPWVRHAVVRRAWPDTLVVRLEEHRPAAFWQGSGGAGVGGAGGANAGSGAGGANAASERLVNDLGEVFEANLAELDDAAVAAAATAALPTFAGPEGSAAAMLALYRRLLPVLARVDQQIELLALSDRGSWRVETHAGAAIELGRGSDAQVLERTLQFVQTLTEATEKWHAPLEMADLRHNDGYAVRLRGISVASAASAAAATKTTKTN